ncbi:hypothetical protein F4827_005266 [Paraburkholderia bannensis]|uniref:Uncharacterized protein n=1 Tax=Paraburkholderia bannensis TaxID=765414 RepID=A0A7W9U1X0_9BURK|nr:MULTISPECIES: hypothetical protein [Paraburkholderia]MBB3260363.1 hypothetical protein [Paraburkholderia sp. WP4_3_2]MBB6105399.1 hypothetical protein [Paraburkholderia bannensis]
MKYIAIVCLAFCLCAARVADAQDVNVSAEVKLVDGPNDIALDGVTVRVIKGYVGTLTAHSYETYTSYVMPEKQGGTWLQIPLEDSNGTTTELRTVESADSTVQAVSMYRSNGKLYAVVAAKTGDKFPDLYLKPAPVMFKVYRFNGSLDVARFKLERTISSKSEWMDAGDALNKAYFSK